MPHKIPESVLVVIHTAGRTDYPWLGVHGYGPIALALAARAPGDPPRARAGPGPSLWGL